MESETLTPKEKLFQTAARLFFQHGYRAVGVDTIAAESGIGKMTLYRHFPSKDDLIAAYLRDSVRNFWRYFEENTREARSARGKLHF
jgi:AcrR family transcriptional regulator